MAWNAGWGTAVREEVTDPPPTRWAPNAAPKGACLRQAWNGSGPSAHTPLKNTFTIPSLTIQVYLHSFS